MKYLKVIVENETVLLPINEVKTIVTNFISIPIMCEKEWIEGILYYQKKVMPMVSLGSFLLNKKVKDAVIAVICTKDKEETAIMVSGILREVEIEASELEQEKSILFQLKELKRGAH